MRMLFKTLVTSGLLGLLFVALSCSGDKNKTMTEEEFTRFYLNQIQQQHSDRAFAITGHLEITSGNHKHYLDNAYVSYRAKPESRDSIVSYYIKALESVYADEESPLTNRIIPVIKPNEYLDFLKKNFENQEESDSDLPLHERYNDDLIIVYRQDSEYRMSTIGAEDLKTWEVENDSLQNLSLENLKRVVYDFRVEGGDGVYALFADGVNEASLILLKEIWTKENFDVKGDLVIAIPTRDLLMVTGSRDQEGFEKIKALAEEMYDQGDHAITPHLFKWNGEQFERFKK